MNIHQREESFADELQTSWMAKNDNFVAQDLSTREYLWSEFQTVLRPEEPNVGPTLKTGLEGWFVRLYELHSQPSTRFYHTPIHLEEMLRYFRLTQRIMDDWKNLDNQVFLLAIFFHDAIYDAKSSTNESDSAILFQQFAKDFDLDRDLRDDVVEYILATRTHDASETRKNIMQLQLFLDLDLAVLGKNAPAYEQYAKAIRQEYSFVEHAVYCSKRAEILETFLLKQRIFFTDLFHHALDSQARSNLRSEIESLSRGIIPGTATWNTNI